MTTESASTDMSIGLSAVFVALALAGALGMYLFAISHDTVSSGWAFAVAMLGAAAAVAAVHVY
jgi:hypothetical protein